MIAAIPLTLVKTHQVSVVAMQSGLLRPLQVKNWSLSAVSNDRFLHVIVRHWCNVAALEKKVFHLRDSHQNIYDLHQI